MNKKAVNILVSEYNRKIAGMFEITPHNDKYETTQEYMRFNGRKETEDGVLSRDMKMVLDRFKSNGVRDLNKAVNLFLLVMDNDSGLLYKSKLGELVDLVSESEKHNPPFTLVYNDSRLSLVLKYADEFMEEDIAVHDYFGKRREVIHKLALKIGANKFLSDIMMIVLSSGKKELLPKMEVKRGDTRFEPSLVYIEKVLIDCNISIASMEHGLNTIESIRKIVGEELKKVEDFLELNGIEDTKNSPSFQKVLTEMGLQRSNVRIPLEVALFKLYDSKFDPKQIDLDAKEKIQRYRPAPGGSTPRPSRYESPASPIPTPTNPRHIRKS